MTNLVAYPTPAHHPIRTRTIVRPVGGLVATAPPPSVAADSGSLTLTPVSVTPIPGPVSVASETGNLTLEPVEITPTSPLIPVPNVVMAPMIPAGA